ncbi:MAG: hypothetical protein AB2A00_27240 [Myxococcota bacterium]
MPISVHLVENVAVWLVQGTVGRTDMRSAFVATGPVRERHAGRGRLLVVWSAEIVPEVRDELTQIHRGTAGMFERMACVGTPATLTLIAGRAGRTPGGAGVEGFQRLEDAVERISDGASATVIAQLKVLLPRMRAALPEELAREAGAGATR